MTLKTYIFLLSALLCHSLFGVQVDQGLKELSFREKRCLRSFFNKAVKQDQAGHVLHFSTKPVALVAIVLESKGKTFKKELLALEGLEVLKKHRNLFPHPNFIFSENLFEPDKDLSVLHIYLINKTSLKSCLKKHLKTYQEILGSSFSPEEFISQLERGVKLPSLIKKDELLTGLLLGFGEESSQTFKEMRTNPLSKSKFYQFIEIKKPKGCQIEPVIFGGDPTSEEVQQLTSIYEQELESIWSTYKKTRKPLKTSLERLCTHESLDMN